MYGNLFRQYGKNRQGVLQKASNLIAVVGVLLLELRLRILGEILKFSSTMFEGNRLKLQQQGVIYGSNHDDPLSIHSTITVWQYQANLLYENDPRYIQ